MITGVRWMPSKSLTKPIDGLKCRFIISAWIFTFDIFNKSEGRRLESLESNHKPIMKKFLIRVSDLSGAKNFSFRQIRFILGWRSKPKLNDGLDVRPKGYWWKSKKSTIFYVLGLDWIWQEWPMNNPYSEHVSTVKKHTIRNNPAVKYFCRKQPSSNVFLQK